MKLKILGAILILAPFLTTFVNAASLTCRVSAGEGGNCNGGNGATQKILSLTNNASSHSYELKFNSSEENPEKISATFYTVFNQSTSETPDRMRVFAEVGHSGNLSMTIYMDRNCNTQNGREYCTPSGNIVNGSKLSNGNLRAISYQCGLLGEHGGQSVNLITVCEYK